MFEINGKYWRRWWVTSPLSGVLSNGGGGRRQHLQSVSSLRKWICQQLFCVWSPTLMICQLAWVTWLIRWDIEREQDGAKERERVGGCVCLYLCIYVWANFPFVFWRTHKCVEVCVPVPVWMCVIRFCMPTSMCVACVGVCGCADTLCLCKCACGIM